MPRRILWTVAIAVAGLLAALGTIVVALAPGALIAIAITATIAGVATTAQVHEARRGDAAPRRLPAEVRAGVAAAAATAVALLAVAGIIGLLGSASAYVLPPLAAAAALRAWRRHADRRHLATAHHTAPLPAPVVAATRIDPAVMSVPQLCRAWDRSCRLLRDLPAGGARIPLIGIRERLLDELERRDPAGFDRWIHRSASASNHPGRYLTGGNPTTPPMP